MFASTVNDGLDKEAARRKKDLAEIQQKELELWEQWKNNGERPDDLRPLLQSYKPVIRYRANQWSSRADLPPEAVHAEFQKSALDAFRTYDPNRGTKLSTHVNNKFKQAYRWVQQHQDPVRMQERRYYQAGAYDNAMAQLDDVLGREPTTREVAEHLGWDEAEVGRMQKEKQTVHFSSGYEGGYDPTSIMPSRDAEKLKLVRYELNPEELQVYDYTLGTYGKPQLRPGEIAKKLGMSPSKVTRIRQAIAGKLEDFD